MIELILISSPASAAARHICPVFDHKSICEDSWYTVILMVVKWLYLLSLETSRIIPCLLSKVYINLCRKVYKKDKESVTKRGRIF